MVYKLLGYVVWKAGRIYLRRNLGGTKTKAAVAVLGIAAAGAALVAGQRVASSSSSQ